ncbi:MAG: ribosome small subunit-dependent GTPase A [Bacteroidaceae bacterium]|nr:ribosome small subunit-dependent GTPase A [Bacteroidaceae bacterium]MDE6000535.1 ribosome small subunit-dependent GTPase A [Bacteroidaceae bacterium]MDE6721679.1 ribosome small subunit-dependent GTPase A [Bacteroidaceae bacterium]
MHGLVIRNTGYSYTVKSDAGEVFDCKVKGNFRIRGIRTTNPVAIGDKVTFLPQEVDANIEQARQGLIVELDDRKNYIIRKSTNLSKQSHIIAANIDRCFLIVTIQQPETPLQFIDRFLASAEAYSVPVTLIFNKIDLIDETWKDYLDGVINLYETIGYPCHRISAKTGEGVEELKALLQGKTTLLSGNSGVGKSTLINVLFPHLHLRTNEISDAYNTGKHTTTFSEMYEVGADGYIIDTPGIKGFGTFDMKKEEVSHYFKEIFHFSADCRFNNCTHTHEPHCAVIEAVERHDIAESRYNSYLSMLDDEKEDKYRPAY